MLILFSNHQLFYINHWVYQESQYLSNRFEYQKKYSIDNIVDREEWKSYDLWKIFEEHFVDIKKIFLSISPFLSLFDFLQFRKPLGFYVEPRKFKIMKQHPKLDKRWIGLQKYALSNQPLHISMINDSIQHHDISWLRWGIRHLDLHDLDIWNETSFQTAIDYQAKECIEYMMECDYDVFEEFIEEKYEIKITETMRAEEILQRILEKEIASLRIS